MGKGRSAVRGTAPSFVVDLTSVPDDVPSRVRLVPAPARRPAGRRSDATGPLSLVPRPRRSPLARAVRAVAFPAVVLAVLALGAWETHRIVLAQQPSTTVVASPTLVASWGRLVVLHTTTWPRSGTEDPVVDVVVRVVGSGKGVFDPAAVTLRGADGEVAPVSLGATRRVRLAAGRAVEGHLGFAPSVVDGPLTLVVLDAGGVEHGLGLRLGAIDVPDTALPPASWTPAS
jgi:hypothetical protein